jgi:hypothetical protein
MKLLVALHLIIGGAAVLAGPLLWPTGGLGMGGEVLDSSPFDSFLVPGIVLTCLGLSLIVSASSLMSHHKHAQSISFSSGILLLGWIAVESYWISDGRALQIVIFLAALAIVVLSVKNSESNPKEPTP